MLHRKLFIFRMTRNHDASEQENARKDYSRGQLQLVKAFGAIFAVSALTYLPMVVSVILYALDVLFYFHPYHIMVTYIIFVSRSVLHPMVESYMTHEIRDVVSRFCCARCQLLNKDGELESGTGALNSSDSPEGVGKGGARGGGGGVGGGRGGNYDSNSRASHASGGTHVQERHCSAKTAIATL